MKNYLLFILLLTVLGCTKQQENSIAPADERIKTAKTELIEKLTSPSNGWVLNYQPVPGAGIYYLLLNFDNNGVVTIQSDVKGDTKDFYNDTLTYRIDNRLSLELIFETYGVFHYLFEQRASTFEAEFEFLFVEQDGNNLVFASKTDVSTEQTVITLVPAPSNAEDAFSRGAYENWNAFEETSPQFLGALPAQQVVLTNQNISVFWNVDFLERNINVSVAGVGSTISEISTNNNFSEIDHTTGYMIANGKLILLTPFSFSINGSNYTISEVELNNFSLSGPPLCPTSVEGTPVYTGTIPGIGPCVINKTLYDYKGSFFVPYADNPYSVNVLYVIDGDGFSLSQSGSINSYFPTAVGFAFNYGFIPEASAPQEPSYAVGLYIEDASNDIQTYLREFDMTTTEGNKVHINLLNNYYFSDTPGTNDQQNLGLITDEIFEGGVVYASGVDAAGTDVFRLYNPCNGYEVYLVK